MSGKKTLVKVTIVGEEYSLRSDASPERTEAVAHYVDQAIRTVMAGLAGGRAGGATPNDLPKAAILAALQITNDLFDAREDGEELTQEMRELAADLRRLLPPAKRGA